MADLTANEAEIKTRLGNIAGADANLLYDAIIDYVDPDFFPTNLSSFAAEQIPLLNEILITNRIISTSIGLPATYRNEWDILVELFYPFSKPLPSSELEIVVNISTDGDILFSDTGTVDVNQPWSTNSPYNVFNLLLIKNGTSPSIPTQATFDIALRVKSSPSDVLDQIEQFDINWSDFGTTTNGPGSGPSVGNVQREVDDPRINWDWTLHWVNSVTPTPNLENDAISYNTGSADGSWIVHVANSSLYSVGELGHLLYDPTRPWQTIRFLGSGNTQNDQTAQVLDFFTVYTNNSGRGKININSPVSEVIEAAFVGLEARRWRDDDAPIPSASVNASILAAAIQSPATNILNNLSELPDKLTETEVINALGGGVDPAYAEGVIRDSLGLIGVRQNMFTIFGLVQSGFEQTPGDPDTFVDLAEQKFVTVIWRDPYPDALGRHQVITRYFKWLVD